jgi:hypothetical protein
MPETPTMLEAGSILLQMLWLLGMVTNWRAGGLIHLLLAGAVLLIAMRLLSRGT